MAARVTAAKKTAAKRPARRSPLELPSPPAPSGDSGGGGFEVLRLTSKSHEPQDLVPLFEIDGVEYSIPRKPRPNIGLQFLHLVRTRGELAATDYLLTAVLGEDGHQALRECETLTDDHLQWLLETIQGLVLGTVEAPKA